MGRTGNSIDAAQRNKETLQEDLLRLYLEMPKEQRHERFACTARVARITGLSQRTVQLWIESGAIRAVNIGRKYQVDLDTLKDYLRLIQSSDQKLWPRSLLQDPAGRVS
jgi:excisionase family DNA binding protein